MQAHESGRTRERLIEAASALFAERGFHGTTIRDIADRARVNVAAGHYYYGSKKALYLEVLRAQFADIRARLERGGGTRPAAELARLSRAALVAVLRARVGTMLEVLLGPPPSLHATLMQREMCDPSEALPVIVEEFVRPMMQETREIIAHLRPELRGDRLDRAVFSILGQALFYRLTMPATLRLLALPAYPRGFARKVAEHITEFSIGGLAHGGTRRRRARAR